MAASAEKLREQLRAINYQSYGMYKKLEGGYDFESYTLFIDHVQGDPFAAPSRVRVSIPAKRHGFDGKLFDNREKRIALEDLILRRFRKSLNSHESRRMGSGKSGNLTTCRAGQEMLERIAVLFTQTALEARFEAGFPARGRTILADELEIILFEIIPEVVKETFFAGAYRQDVLTARMQLAENQKAIRSQLSERGLIAFVANGAVLPRESGISERPMKDAVVFQSPESLEVTLKLPFGGSISGMGVREGITVITGGGYHGKSTLLKALEAGIYNHIEGDGREYVLTREDAVKIRSEDGRCVRDCNISPFIGNLPGGTDTVRFSTENASGSTSQAANVIEAIEAGSRLFLVDEDTTATNFMIRDSLMSQLVPDAQEPIRPFIRKIKSLYRDHGISTVIVAGSCGDYLTKADCVLLLDCYQVKDITEKARELSERFGAAAQIPDEPFPPLSFAHRWDLSVPRDKYGDYRIKTTGTDTVAVNYEVIDVRYLEQLKSEGQCVTLGLLLRELFTGAYGAMTRREAVEAIQRKLERDGLLAVTQKGYPCGHPEMVRPLELFACAYRLRGLKPETLKALEEKTEKKAQNGRERGLSHRRDHGSPVSSARR